ncbi:MAG: BglG family transcription antiterminator [Clostridium sp.]|nr:BglG family transcription antiterminator [Clostridium sp.]
MSLDERGLKILKLLVDNPMISGSQLEKEAGLSRKQLSYSLKKINYYLKENGMEEIGRMRTGKFIISQHVINSYKTNQFSYDKGDYVFMEKERLYLIALILLQHKEELSINHFSYILKISKNTVLHDLKKLQTTILNEFDLKLWYDRSKGYCLIGKEYEKRTLMIRMIRSILPLLSGESILSSILEIEDAHLRMLCEDVENVEKTLNVRYTDERIREIPYILYFILRRIEAQKFLDILPEDYQHIAGTSEYGSIMHIFNKYGIQRTMDKLYLVSQFQMSSVNFADSRSKKFEKELMKAAEKTLDNFENLVCIHFQDRKSLLDALIQHLKPALYRIRYQYHVEGNILNMILPHHAYLFEITKHAMAAFEEMFHLAIPNEEMAYITILFGGWMTKEGTLDMLEKKSKAIVVCTNGISISNFLFLKLKEAFPELEFVCALSSRQFYEYRKDFDVVFATVHLDTRLPQFLVKPIMDDNDLHNLRKKVCNEILNKTIYEVNSASLLHVIEKFADVRDRKGLAAALKNYLGETNEEQVLTEHVIHAQEDSLSELLTEKTVRIATTAMDWQTAICEAAAPLLENGCITQQYVDNMLHSVIADKPIWTIAKGLVLAHASVEEGVNALGMSLLKLPESICFHGYMHASIVVVMATPNREVHLKALYALIDLVENDEDFERMKATNSIEELLEIISKERN